MAQCVQCGRQLPGLSFGKKICRWCVQHEAAQRGEDSPLQRVETAPWLRSQTSSAIVTQLIFGANAIVFLGMALSVGLTLFGDPAWNELTVRLGANVGMYTIAGQWWRLLTNIFIHGGLLHFAFNMWCLWSLGRLAESVYGPWTFAIVYLLCGISGSLASVIWNPMVSSVGASGAIFGIAGALISSFYLGEFSLPRSAISGMLRSVVAFVGYNLVFGAMIAHVDNAAHVGGLVMGLILGALIARVAPAQDAFLRRISVLLVGVLIILLAGFGLARSRSYLVHGRRGLTQLQQGKADDAIKELQKSVRQRPNFIPTHEALAQAYVVKGDFKDAAEEWKRVAALDPRNDAPYYQLGLLYLKQSLPAQAEQAFSQMLRINPNSADGHAALAWTLADQHRNQEALDEYKRAADIDSLYPDVYYHIGLMQARLNQVDAAVASLLKQRQDADTPENERLLAALYDAKGMKNEAATARKKQSEFQTQH